MDGAGSAYVAGGAATLNFPATPGAVQRVNKSQTTNAYVAKCNAAGPGLLFQNQTTNGAMLWYLTSGVFQSAKNLSLAPPSIWQIVGPR